MNADFTRIDVLQAGETAESRAVQLLEDLKNGKIGIETLMGPIGGLPNLSPDINIPPGSKTVFPSAPNVEFYPKDAANVELEHSVHPHDYVNPTPSTDYDLVVIGAGAAGLISSIMGAWLGKRVALIERHAMGGDCLNTGCVPSKAVLACANAFHSLSEVSQYGISLNGTPSIDFGAVMQRMRGIRAKISHHDSVARYGREFCEHVYVGHAEFLGDQKVRVTDDKGSIRLLTYRKAMIASGASAAVIPPLVNIPHLTNSAFFNLTQLPPRVIVIGCGPIGMELSQALCRFGSRVVCLEAGPRFLPREDQDAVQILRQQLQRDGVELYVGVTIHKVECAAPPKTSKGDSEPSTSSDSHTSNGLYCAPWNTYTITCTTSDGTQHTFSGDCLLNATGRVPNVFNMGLEAVNVDWDNRRGVLVNDFYMTSNQHIYACGDCTSSYKFTHAADFQARIAVRNMFLGEVHRSSDLLIPWCTYTDPEIAHVGKYEEELRSQGREVEVFVRQLGDVDRCLCDGISTGFVKIISIAGSRQIVGATICGKHAGDMISELTLCIQYGLTIPQLAGTIHPYPTQQEAVRQAALGFNKHFKNPQGAPLLALKMLMKEREELEKEKRDSEHGNENSSSN